MSLTSVKMSEEVWLTCLTHALSTETEEIMGLLLGDIQHSKNGNVTALIWGALPQPRSDRQKDRVETNPEQLTAASVHAERMTMETGTTTRVIGWYHSHPHITVLPSHVDVRTQAMYQLLDSGFIGLIFSCFSEDAQKVGRIQVIAFQSLDGKQNHVMKPVSLCPVQKSSVINIESSISSSDNSMAMFGSSKGESMEQDTGDSGATATASKGAGKSPRLGGFFANADAKTGNNYHPNSLNNAIHDLDPMDMSEGMQEAMHLSNLEMSGAEFVRKEIPLHVLPTSSLLKLDSPLSSFTNLQRVLYEEERTAYNQAMAQNTRNGKIHPLSFVHHTSTYKASMCKMIEYCLSPAMNALQDRLRENEIQLKLLGEEATILEAELSRGSPSNSSPRSPSQGLRSSASFGQRDLYPPNLKSASGSRSRRG
ncbi:26S proteasome regulatory complex, subunit RPN11 [Handroanthus impetiginosus]|uniref:26S proteasome regulatory complex, subunit RPN11 n=1 Tax=Handroanthus impetiginosus TaxID=429701 RepID=A0A2G9GYP0_9LAMI|nr:26S proteasome regulatory complex, subunit RPN11 [Handroanthus impetiginosus]